MDNHQLERAADAYLREDRRNGFDAVMSGYSHDHGMTHLPLYLQNGSATPPDDEAGLRIWYSQWLGRPATHPEWHIAYENAFTYAVDENGERASRFEATHYRAVCKSSIVGWLPKLSGVVKYDPGEVGRCEKANSRSMQKGPWRSEPIVKPPFRQCGFYGEGQKRPCTTLTYGLFLAPDAPMVKPDRRYEGPQWAAYGADAGKVCKKHLAQQRALAAATVIGSGTRVSV